MTSFRTLEVFLVDLREDRGICTLLWLNGHPTKYGSPDDMSFLGCVLRRHVRAFKLLIDTLLFQVCEVQ